MPTNVNAAVTALQPYQPGKPVEELARERGVVDIVKLASNENPRGPGEPVRRVLRAGFEALSRYPDANGFRLKAALAEHHGVAAAQITLGNGSNDVLDLAARVAVSPGTSGVVDEHCFVVYPLAIAGANGRVVRVPSRNRGHDLDGLAAAIDDTTRIVYVANPNNPTGTWVDDAAIRDFLAAVPGHVWVVVDEAYAEYLDPQPAVLGLVERHPNLIVTRTFSKIYGLAALRIGYSISAPDFADWMNRVPAAVQRQQPRPAAAEAALADADYVAESRRINVAASTRSTGIAGVGSRMDPVVRELHHLRSGSARRGHLRCDARRRRHRPPRGELRHAQPSARNRRIAGRERPASLPRSSAPSSARRRDRCPKGQHRRPSACS